MNKTLVGIWGILRLNKPAAFFLIGWPTLAALWLAQCAMPPLKLILLFISGVVVTRSAGCVINDLTDRKFDGYIERTKNRPLVSGKLSVTSAFVILFVLGLIALWIVWQLNWLCFYLALVGIGLTILYPFCKRFLAIPQMVLAITFNWGIIIAFAAVTNRVPSYAWLWLAVNMFWTLAYDSQYALCDVEDDQKLGLKSSAIYFGNLTPAFILFCQMQMLILLCLTGYFFELDIWFWCALPIVVVFYVYQTQLIQSTYRANYFQAFANNKWIGLVIFLGIFFSESF